MNTKLPVTAMKQFLCDESGQTTTEYVLILAVILTIIMQFKKKLLSLVTVLFKGLDDKTEKVMEDL